MNKKSKCFHCHRKFIPSRHSSGKFCSQECYQTHPKKRIPLRLRFWKFVHKTTYCWLWTGADDCERRPGRKGRSYGIVKYKQKNIGAHQASWILHFGKIPKGKQVCHKCDIPRCVKPSHLFLGTNSDNQKDAVRKGRHRPPDNRGSRHGLSKLKESQVKEIRSLYPKLEYKQGRVLQLARKFRVSKSTIYQILLGLRWKHLNKFPRLPKFPRL